MNQAAFAPARGIQELSFEEINKVGGGLLPALLPLAPLIIGAAAGYITAKSTDDCKTTTVTTVNGNTTTTRTVTTCS
ncbi:hypothetical protein [Sphingorhabdus sp.]|jgi:hypothetical protein|uniref:hypothetical protein n=1 Tax=Sphingorhabdus sp. TaxID=1902408 RepID=UPI0037836034